MDLKCHLISGCYDQAVGEPPDTCGSRKGFCMHANNYMQSLYIDRAFRRMCDVLVRTIFVFLASLVLQGLNSGDLGLPFLPFQVHQLRQVQQLF